MNRTSGEVYVNKPLDRETQPAFSMVVGAFNYETKAYNSQTTIDGKRLVAIIVLHEIRGRKGGRGGRWGLKVKVMQLSLTRSTCDSLKDN